MAIGARELTAPHYSTLPWDRELRIVPGFRVAKGRLEVCEEVARGGMAVVYRAIDHGRGGAEVALKVGTAKANRPETEARFHNEARLGASLAGHPNVVSPMSVGRLDGPEGFEGRMYLVTELVDGEALDRVIAGFPTGLPISRACAIARDVAQALVDLHRAGIVHRDIKPGNVLLTHDTPERARVIDFGFAYATGDGWEDKSPDLTEDGCMPGTPLYMSPQQVAHEQPAPAFDVYALGVMMYELLVGDPPYHGLSLGHLLSHKCDPNREPYALLKLCPEFPDELATLVHRCMRFDPDARPSARAIVEQLDAVLGELERTRPADASVEHPTAVPERPGPRQGRRPRTTVLVGAAVIAMAAVAGMAWTPGDDALASEASQPMREPPALTAATYAKAERTEPRTPTDAPIVGIPSPPPQPELAPSQPEAKPSPPKSKPTHPSNDRSHQPQPRSRTKPNPIVEPTVDHCPDDVRAARDAAKTGQWTRVLRLTKNVRCWSPDTVDERIKLRTWALYETERFAECAKEGKGSTDRNVARWTSICAQRVREEGDTP